MTGEWTGWYESGKLKWCGSLAHGRFTGELTSWRANGDQLAHVTSFELAPDAVVH